MSFSLKPKISLPQELYETTSYAVLDIETTGLDPTLEKIVEIACVIVAHDKIIGEMSLLLNPGIAIPAETSKIHGIYDRDVQHAFSVEEGLAKFEYFVEGLPLIAHNAAFDFAFIQKALSYNLPNKLFDSVALARSILPLQKSFGLSSLCQYYGIVNEQAHRALSDCRATAQVVSALLTDWRNTPKEERKILFRASGENTYAIRDQLKKAGFRWHSEFRFWSIYLSLSQVEDYFGTYKFMGFDIEPHEFDPTKS